MNDNKLLQVGDTLTVSDFYYTHRFEITRVTKTLAVSKCKNDGYENKFRRLISSRMLLPSHGYSEAEFTVERAGELSI